MLDVYKCKIDNKLKLNDLTYEFSITEASLAGEIVAGQFLHIKCGNERILRRPVSISDVNNNTVSFIVEIRGEGTKWLCDRKTGDELDLLGPLGNGFSLPAGNVILVGGGLGIPPLVYTARLVVAKIAKAMAAIKPAG